MSSQNVHDFNDRNEHHVSSINDDLPDDLNRLNDHHNQYKGDHSQSSIRMSADELVPPARAQTRVDSSDSAYQALKPWLPDNPGMQTSDTIAMDTVETPKRSQGHRSSLFSRRKNGAHHKALTRIPLLHRPKDDSDGPWLDKEQRGEEWISLFYDLAVVAVLTIFSSSHELNHPGNIPKFFGYFLILSWIWTAQTHYDIRFQAADNFHILFKALQIICFVYIGAASGNWNPGTIRDDDAYLATLSTRSAANQRASSASFKTVAITFLISRVGLAVQYIVCVLNGRRVQRAISGPVISLLSLALSTLCTLIATVIPAHSRGAVIAKVTIFFSSVLVEIIGVLIQIFWNRYGHTNTKAIGERYGAFTLVTLSLLFAVYFT